MTAQLPVLPEADFQAILSVVAGSERGRSFLAELGKRRRAEDAMRLLAAIDRIEAHAVNVEAERARQRADFERAAEVVRQLAEVLKDLRPLADARVRVRALQARDVAQHREPAQTGGLERRFAALVDLDEHDLESGLKLFG